jgi:hypothetical protein
MAGSPIAVRRPLARPLSPRRIEANRRNSARSTGPRSPDGKARVARNAIKHGFFAAMDRWTPGQHREFAETRDALRSEFEPCSALEESCVTAMAASCVRTAALLRYENIAALNFHHQQDRELNAQIAASEPAEAARLEDKREELRRAGLWRPTIPAPKEALAIARYCGSLDRAFHRALSNLEELRAMRIGGPRPSLKTREQSHYEASPNGVLRAAEGPRVRTTPIAKNDGTNPLSPAFAGNRHQRRRAQALARGR